MKKILMLTTIFVAILSMALPATVLAASQQDPCNGATISLSPSTTVPGGTVVASGGGIATWAPGYEIRWDSVSGTLLLSGTADGSGNYSTNVTIPSDASLGNHTLYLVATAPNESSINCPASLTVIAATATEGVQPDAYAQARATLPSTGIFLLPAAGLLAAGAGLMLRRRRG